MGLLQTYTLLTVHHANLQVLSEIRCNEIGLGVLSQMGGVHGETAEALDLAKMAYDAAAMARDEAEGAQTNLTGLLQAINDFIDRKRVTPAEIQQVARMALDTQISLTPQEIQGEFLKLLSGKHTVWTQISIIR